jgi:ligand-binding SRPBCC domain-containing protein
MHSIAVQTALPSQELPASIVMSCAIAESNHCHQTHAEGTKTILIDYLDAEIQKQEDILEKLRIARLALD